MNKKLNMKYAMRHELIVGSFALCGVYSFDEISSLKFINQFIDSVFVMPSDLNSYFAFD